MVKYEIKIMLKLSLSFDPFIKYYYYNIHQIALLSIYEKKNTFIRFIFKVWGPFSLL